MLALFPENQNNVAAGLVLGIVCSFIIHPAPFGLFAAFAGFWFAIAAYYGGISAAILASFLAQVGATWLYIRPRDAKSDQPKADRAR